MAVPPSLLPNHSEKTLGALKAERTVKRITFNPSEAHLGETLYVSVPKLSEHEVIVSGSLTLVFNISLSRGHETTISCKTCPGPWSTSSMSSLPPPVSRTRMGTTSTRSSKTSSSQRTSGPTCLARASRVWICAGFALALATRRPPAWMRKTSCRASTTNYQREAIMNRLRPAQPTPPAPAQPAPAQPEPTPTMSLIPVKRGVRKMQ